MKWERDASAKSAEIHLRPAPTPEIDDRKCVTSINESLSSTNVLGAFIPATPAPQITASWQEDRLDGDTQDMNHVVSQREVVICLPIIGRFGFRLSL